MISMIVYVLCDISVVASDSAGMLEVMISLRELREAALSMHSGKCRVPDGYPFEFYKQFFSMYSN